MKKSEDNLYRIIALPTTFEGLQKEVCRATGRWFPFNLNRVSLHIQTVNPPSVIDYQTVKYLRDSEQLYCITNNQQNPML